MNQLLNSEVSVQDVIHPLRAPLATGTRGAFSVKFSRYNITSVLVSHCLNICIAVYKISTYLEERKREDSSQKYHNNSDSENCEKCRPERLLQCEEHSPTCDLSTYGETKTKSTRKLGAPKSHIHIKEVCVCGQA